MTDQDRALDALKRGMSTEIWGRRFYEEAIARTEDETGKRVFGTLVDEESKHLDILRAEYVRLSKGKGWLSVDEDVALAESVDPTDVFPEAAQAERLISAEATDEQALEMAMDFERRGYNLYAEAARSASSAAEKDVWEYLAKAEDAHYAFLDKTLEFLRTDGAWYFDERELPFFEG